MTLIELAKKLAKKISKRRPGLRLVDRLAPRGDTVGIVLTPKNRREP